MEKKENQRLTRLQETRQQGTLTFPCTMYFADAWEEAEHTKFEVKLHWHDAIELLHFEQGVYQVGVNMERCEIREETFGFIDSGQLHRIGCDQDYREQAVLFDPSILSSANVDAASKELVDPLIHGNLRLPSFVTRQDPGFDEIKQEFGRIRRAFEQAGKVHGDQRFVMNPSAQLRIKAALMNIFAILQETGQLSYEETGPDQRIEALKKVMTYVRENYASKIYIQELAKIMNMNEQYFCRFFKKTLGKTPVAYMNEVRVRQAVLMLEKTEVSVVEVANACGYGNMGHFITEFKRLTGRTPLEYRKTNRVNKPSAEQGGVL